MIHFSLFRARDGAIAGFACKGHAGFAEAGSDIVCAAVSTLTITCANALETVAKQRPETDCGEGALTITLAPDMRTHDTQVILETLWQGVRDIQEQYPANIRVTEACAAERRK